MVGRGVGVSFRRVAGPLAAVAGLLLVPLLMQLLRSTTHVQVVVSPGSVYAQVEDTRLDLPADSPDSALAPGAPISASIDDAAGSLYWQPAVANGFGAFGSIGEALQRLRPNPAWGAPVVAPGAAQAPTANSFTLTGGRQTARLTLQGAANGSGVQLTVRPERRGMAWWRVEGGKPVEQLAGASYRPPMGTSLRDLTGDLLVIAAAADALGLLAWLAGLLFRGREVRPVPGTRVTGRSLFRAGGLLSSPRATALGFFLGAAVLGSAACLLTLDGIPHVQDDVAYIFQGRIFALGRSWVPVPPGPEFFQNGFIQMFEGRWFSKYPPGYPLLLAPGLLAGLPWLINPLATGVTLALVYAAGLRMFGPHTATWAGLLGLVSPWMLFMSGSYMSHPTTMMWTALFLFALVQTSSGLHARSPVRGRFVWPLLGGLGIGMAFITREWTALGIGVGAALWGMADLLVLSRRGNLRRALGSYALLVVGFVPPLFFLLYENSQLTGDWLRFAQDLVGSYDRPGFGPGHGDARGHTPALGVYNTLVYLRTLGTTFDGWPAPLSLAPLALGAVAWARRKHGREAAWDTLLWMGALGLVGAYFLWWSSTTIYGPRYWFEAMPFLLLIAGRGLDLLGKIAGRQSTTIRWAAPAVLYGVLALYSVTQSIPVHAARYTDYNGITAGPIRRAEEAGLSNALVFVALDPSKPNRDYGKVFFANDPMLRGSRVYARDLGPERNRELLGLFPGRTPYFLPLDGPPAPGFGK